MGKQKPVVIDKEILEDLRTMNDLVMLDRVECPLAYLEGMARLVDAVELLSLIPDMSVDVVLTDEPFGIGGFGIITFTSRKDYYSVPMDFDEDLPAHLMMPWVYQAARILKPGGVLINCGIASWSTSFEGICIDAGLDFRAQIPWLITNPPTRVRHGGWRSAHQMVWIASKGSLKDRMKRVRQQELINWTIEATCPHCQTRFPVAYSHNYELTEEDWSNLVFLEPSKPSINRVGHVNEKPDWLPARFLWLLSEPGDIVVDPFAGSGAFILMAARMGRRMIAGDYDQEWVDYINRQMEGIQVVL
jgi:DNA modification methylase